VQPTAIDAALARLAARRFGVFTRQEAAVAGVTARSIRSRVAVGSLVEVAPGVLVHAGRPPSWLQQVAIGTLAAGGAVASHRTAARMHHLDGRWPDEVEVSVPAHRRGATGLCLVHRVLALPPQDVVVVDGLPATGVARTLADLGSVTSTDAVLAALDSARRTGVSTRWLRQTARRLARPGQHGPHLLLDLLDMAGGDTVPESWLERLVERLLAVPGMPPLVRQHVVRDPRGRFVARVDLAIPSIRLAIEAHSRRFHFGDAAGRRDEDRDLRLSAAGWAALYVGYQHTRRAADVVPLVVDAVVARMSNR
jgi:hypothetical protein